MALHDENNTKLDKERPFTYAVVIANGRFFLRGLKKNFILS